MSKNDEKFIVHLYNYYTERSLCCQSKNAEHAKELYGDLAYFNNHGTTCIQKIKNEKVLEEFQLEGDGYGKKLWKKQKRSLLDKVFFSKAQQSVSVKSLLITDEYGSSEPTKKFQDFIDIPEPEKEVDDF